MGLIIPPSGDDVSSGSAYLITGGSTSAVTNGTALLAAYVTAQAATPQGAALSAANRFTIFLLPGVYDLGASTLTLATQFIDIVGISTNTGPATSVAVSLDTTNLGDTIIKSSAAPVSITVTPNDIVIANVCLQTTSSAFGVFALNYSGVNSTPSNRLQNVLLRKPGADGIMPDTKIYAGQYVDVRSSSSGLFERFLGTCSGIFIRCSGAGFAFGATASGLFIECEADGTSLGTTTASGTFIRCREVVVSGTTGGIMAGAFTGTAEDCFTLNSALSYTSGTVRNCNFAGTVENRSLEFSTVRLTKRQSVLTYAASTNVDFNLNSVRTLALTGDVTFTTSNRTAGKSVTLKILADGSTRAFTFPAWIFVGAVAPATLVAAKTAMLKLTCFGAADTDIVAEYTVEA